MMLGTECTKVSKRAVRNILSGILENLFNAQAALAKRDRETKRLVKGYESLCYWDARERFDPFVGYVARELGEVTTGWFWPDPPKGGKDAAEDGVADMLGDDFIDCGMANFYHAEIMKKITGFCDGVREYYEGTTLAVTWSGYDRAIRKSVEAYWALYRSGESYVYGCATPPASRKKKAKKG